MNETREDDVTGRTRFHEMCRPPLQGGDYSLHVEHKVPDLNTEDAGETFEGRLNFSVDAPRFALLPEDVYAVTPAKGHDGAFGGTLPHIVFTRRTLPWETTIDGKERAEDDARPWMALLVLSQEDFPDGRVPAPVSRRLKEVLYPDEADVAGPDVELRAYETQEDKCSTLDLDRDLFRRLAPTLEELPYLSHVREVRTETKETASFLLDGWFSVVVANRVPQAAPPETQADRGEAGGTENRAVLVSLVGMERHLGRGAGGPKLRVVVLSSWSFRCSNVPDFKATMQKIDTARLALGSTGEDESGDPAQKLVSRALSAGYVALPHNTRAGEQAVSWYRGPFVPERLPRREYGFRAAPDAALRYGAASGMLDVSYASAFQLGRLLAMQDRHFAAALGAFRRDVRRQINDERERRRQEARFARDPQARRDANLMRAALATLGGSGASVRTPDGDTDPAKPSGRPMTGRFDLTIPGTINRWLARVALLYRVPFTYLVADSQLLPRESVRFFHMDPAWLKCLMEGATSLGRTAAHDEQIDYELSDAVFDFALHPPEPIRARNPKPDSHFNSPVTAEAPEADAKPATSQLEWWRTGVLLRSRVIEAYPGLEIRATGADDSELSALRIDRLSPEVLLCIFEGEIAQLEIAQPAEGLHFGVSRAGAGFKKLTLRHVAPADANGATITDKETGGQIPLGDDPVEIPLRKDSAERVLDIASLAQLLESRLNALKERPVENAFTSGEFAVQMIERAARVVFESDHKAET